MAKEILLNLQLDSLCRVFEQANSSVSSLTVRGKELIEKVESKIDNVNSTNNLSVFIKECKDEIERIKAQRKPYTDKLLEIQKKFTTLENALSPEKPGTIANECYQLLEELLKEKVVIQQEKRRLLDKAFDDTVLKIENEKSMNQQEKKLAHEQACRLRAAGLAELEDLQLRWTIHVSDSDNDGYLELLKFWWQHKGQYLSREDLDRIFRLAITFAHKQAEKGVFIDSPLVVYRQTPKVA